MTDKSVRNIVIVGGGTAGWMAAAALAKILGTQTRNITLIESEEIGTVGVGEATIPAIILFNKMLEIDEDEFVRATHATFKLGIDFVNWRKLGHRYFHQFGLIGAELKNGVSFTHYWMRWRNMGGEPDVMKFSAEAQAAKEGRFGKPPPRGGRNVPNVNYAYQFDASTYAAYLRKYSEQRGVVRKEGRIVEVQQHPETGFIQSVELADGSRIEGDLFIDCSGFRGLLIEQTLKAGFEDWSHWLPNDRAVAVPCAKQGDPSPFTGSTARESGWQWRIPLQHRTGNGYVYSSNFISDDEAAAKVVENLDGEPLADPRLVRFVAGKRKAAWSKNCIALGLSSGFLEPLESTSIHLIQVGIMRIFAFFPDMDFDPLLAKRYNDEMDLLYDGIRDFIIAHYKVTERDDTPYWDYCRNMSIPASLEHKLELFRLRGEVVPDPRALFTEASWFAVLFGQGLEPEGYHPVADSLPETELVNNLTRIRELIRERVNELPSHGDYLRHVAAGPRTTTFA
ncbi:MAG: tryptophan halogenase family protein [Sphingomicrobium sp.]